jgi:hypothetical protein
MSAALIAPMATTMAPSARVNRLANVKDVIKRVRLLAFG